MRVKAREPLSFPPTAYPPPLLDGAGERSERREREKERKNERKKWREREKRNTATTKELSAILFYLSRLPLDRIHRFLTLRAFSVAPHGR